MLHVFTIYIVCQHEETESIISLASYTFWCNFDQRTGSVRDWWRFLCRITLFFTGNSPVKQSYLKMQTNGFDKNL